MYESVANMELCLVLQPLNLIVFVTDGKSVNSIKPITNDYEQFPIVRASQLSECDHPSVIFFA